MKTAILSLAVLLTSTAIAEELSPLAFPDRKFELPALSLLEAAKQKMPPIFGYSGSNSHLAAHRVESTRKLVSRMPIVSPSNAVDQRMPIKRPDPAVDYKLTTKVPDVESVK
jgi:hypothetical protein